MFVANNRASRRVTTGTYCLIWSHTLRRMIYEDEERRDPLGDLLGSNVEGMYVNDSMVSTR